MLVTFCVTQEAGKCFKRSFPQITQITRIKSKNNTGDLMGIKKPGRKARPGFSQKLAKKLVASYLDRAVNGVNVQPGAATADFSV